jgi:formate dehydrogenase assembly factor FdhD
MKTRAAAKQTKIVRLEAEKRWPGQPDEVAVEEPLEIRIEGRPLQL